MEYCGTRIAPLRDCAGLHLTAGTVLSRHQARPGAEPATVSEGGRIADHRDCRSHGQPEDLPPEDMGRQELKIVASK